MNGKQTFGSDGSNSEEAANDLDAITWQAIDLLLNQGLPEQLVEMRNEVSNDPLRALELAETVSVIEQFRELDTEPSPEFAGKMQAIALQSDRFYRSHYQNSSPIWLMPVVSGIAAAATFCLLWGLDAQQLWRTTPESIVSANAKFTGLTTDKVGARGIPSTATKQSTSTAQQLLNEPVVQVEPLLSPEQASWELAVEEILVRLNSEATGNLRNAFQAGIEDGSDPLKQWLDPSNTIVLLRFEHELRASAAVRIDALRSRGTLPEVDDRVQELANEIADEMLRWTSAPLARLTTDPTVDRAPTANVNPNQNAIAEIAWSVRALIAAGSSTYRAKALQDGGEWLSDQLPELHGEQLVWALTGLVELAAISGKHFEAVAIHGQRLVDTTLEPNNENWRRRLPELLAGRIAVGSLGEACRILTRLPAFGVSPSRCKLVRQLMLGHLRDRRLAGQDRPETLAAMLYGCSDLLDAKANESDRLGWQLLRWKPTHLAPDFATVQQIAWSRAPGSRGYTGLQRELRQLAVLPTPEGLGDRAAFLMCLATNYAGYIGDLLLEDH